MWDHDPIFRYLQQTVAPAFDRLDSPPAPSEGFVASVDFDHVNATALEWNCRECQSCGEPVYQAETHVRATVWILLGEKRPREHMRLPVFCDRKCWADWASA